MFIKASTDSYENCCYISFIISKRFCVADQKFNSVTHNFYKTQEKQPKMSFCLGTPAFLQCYHLLTQWQTLHSSFGTKCTGHTWKLFYKAGKKIIKIPHLSPHHQETHCSHSSHPCPACLLHLPSLPHCLPHPHHLLLPHPHNLPVGSK